MSVGVSILVLIIVIVINAVVANFMKQVAYAKGYDDSAHAFAMAFWLGIIGDLYVVALPDLVAREQNREILEALRNTQKKTASSVIMPVSQDDKLPDLSDDDKLPDL